MTGPDDVSTSARAPGPDDTVGRSVVLPVYRESPTTVTDLIEALHAAGWSEVVVCADAPDEPLREALSSVADGPGTALSVSPVRRGKGGALTAGLEEADGDVLGYVDADGAVPITDLDRLYRSVENGDAAMAVGSRDVGDQTRSEQGPVRRTLGRWYRRLAGTLVDVPVSDVQCGAKAFDREVWEAVGQNVEAAGFAFDTELVARTHRRGYDVREVPIDWSEPGASTVNPVFDAPEMLVSLVRIRRAVRTVDPAVDLTGARHRPTAADSATDGGVTEAVAAVDDCDGDGSDRIDVALVTAHPPDKGHLAEYGERLARAYHDRPDVSVTVVSPTTDGDTTTTRTAADGGVTATAGGSNTPDTDDGDPATTTTTTTTAEYSYDVARVWKRDSFSGARALCRELLSGEYDAVHFNLHMTYFGRRDGYRFLGLTLPALVSLAGDVRVVTTLHDMLDIVAEDAVDRDVGPLARVGAALGTQAVLLGDATTVTSEEFRDTVRERYRPRELHHVPHGTFVDPATDDVTPPADGPFRVLVFGHLGPTKDVGTVVEAVDRLVEDDVDRANADGSVDPAVELVVAGDSHPQHPGYRDRLEAAYGDRPYVRFTGYVPEDELDGVWSEASLAVLPYRTCTGVSGVFQLAKSHATPVVTFDAAGMRTSTVETGGTARFVQPGDATALASELARLRDSPEELREMARENAAAATEFTIDDVAARFVDVLRGDR